MITSETTYPKQPRYPAFIFLSIYLLQYVERVDEIETTSGRNATDKHDVLSKPSRRGYGLRSLVISFPPAGDFNAAVKSTLFAMIVIMIVVAVTPQRSFPFLWRQNRRSGERVNRRNAYTRVYTHPFFSCFPALFRFHF